MTGDMDKYSERINYRDAEAFETRLFQSRLLFSEEQKGSI